MPSDDDLAEAARAFLSAAWQVLERQHIVPTPIFHPYLEVGRDYFGPDLVGLPEYKRLETIVAGSHPRFGKDVPLGERDFPGQYLFSFLQAFVARSAGSSDSFSVVGGPANDSIDDLRTAIHASSWTVACCRVVSHLTTTDSHALEVAGITIAPLRAPPAGTSRETLRVIGSVIRGAVGAFGRDRPAVDAPPESVLIARMDAPNSFDAVKTVSGRIERFLLATRLLWAGTTQSLFEVQGETAFVRRFTPTLVEFRGAGPSLLSPTNLVRRTTRITAEDAPRIEGLWTALEAAEQVRPGMAMTSFAVAMQKFQLSYHAHTWYEQLVDLAIAFEAALSGKDTTDVVLRLKTRAAALLATERDPAPAIFRDVGELYALRSRLVHGGELTEKALARTIRCVSTVPPDAPLGTACGHVVDRMRDLVRRGLLVRICLAADGDDALWPLDEDPGVDAALSDDTTRALWRSRWRDSLASSDAVFAADRPRVAVDAISQEDAY